MLLFHWRTRLFFDPNDTPAATPVVVEPVAPVVPTPAAAPWSADLQTYFGGNAEAIAAADRYQREKIQPYVTQLESSSKDALELWNDLNADPATTARDLIASVYANDPDVVAAYDAIFNTPADPVVETPATPAEEIPAWAKPLVESHQEKVDRELRETEASNYAAFRDGLKDSHSLTDQELAVIDPFISQSPSDPDKAVATCRAWLVGNGIATPSPAPTPAPPPVLGDGTTAAVPPLATQYTKYEQVGDAMKSFFARQAASATPPPVVG